MRIAIVGAYPSTRMGAPYTDPNWQIWTCSAKNAGIVRRWDAWFELHVPFGWDVNAKEVVPGYVEWLRKEPCVYLRDKDQEFDGAVPYPEEDMREEFGPFFFTSTVSCMLALAVSKQPTEIGLWGIELSHDQEYAYQKPGCHYFIQKAWDRGIKVTVPSESKILEPPLEQW